ncbi:hypothetical protein GCM10007989_33510 [Devosia pacifica]|uniref:Uncharacterized protein n=1 Tax=Devosia pacifica TaxID=1335967 RepID=A0A918VXL4_9HYPH|nr:hypothetical protein [Devosia pacifica]GHA34909.1 hypothetical protein GCM10007989_33510 [Devosia pacifica]
MLSNQARYLVEDWRRALSSGRKPSQSELVHLAVVLNAQVDTRQALEASFEQFAASLQAWVVTNPRQKRSVLSAFEELCDTAERGGPCRPGASQASTRPLP